MIGERRVRNGEVELQLLEAVPEGGAGGRPPVLLVHGWPETSLSWRHQLTALADAGWHAIAPDLRGFGRSDCPPGQEPYRIDHVATDLLAVLDDLGAQQGVLVGHDWGSMVVWDTGRLHPERCAGVVGMSVPLNLWPMPPTQLLKAVAGDRFLYILYFQEPGVAEAELDADARRSLRMTHFSASAAGAAQAAAAGVAEAGTERRGLASALPAEGTRFLDGMLTPPDGPLPHIDEADFAKVVADYERSGFRGGLSYYRSLDANFEVTKDLGPDRLTMPTAFIGGAADVVVVASQGQVDAMPGILPDYRGTTLIPGAGHWVQQEAPEATSAALLAFLSGL